MTFLHNIRTVAKYEATTLRRSWFFRLFSIFALMIFTMMNIGLFSPVGGESWEMIAVPSSVPYVNLYLLNIAQSIVVIFLAADFLKRDKKVDTNEVLYTRSMSNFEYIIGKTWGILRLFLGLDVIILSIGLLMNIISKSMSIDLASYLYYLLILSVPTIIFSLGLAFMLMLVIRNQAITFLLLLGIAAMNMFWLWYRAGSIFDYMAFGLPVFKSTMVGFDNLNLILNQRLFYFFLGMTLVLATVLLFKRLPQSKVHTGLTYILMAAFIAGSLICGFNTYSIHKRDLNEKSTVIEVNRQYENRPVVSLTDARIDFEHLGKSYNATAYLKFANDNKESLDRYIFSLNPGLNVSGISSNGKNLEFRKAHHIIDIEAPLTLLPGQTDSVTISYSGNINESFCYPNHTDNLKETPYRIEMLSVNKRQAFLTDQYILLTPETHWYPVAGLNYYPTNPARIKVDFTNFTLNVKPGKGLTAVSQGNLKNENGIFHFSPESPLTGLTLAIGNYLSDTLKVDSVKYIAFHFPEHDYYKSDLSELRDTLQLLVSGIMRELETNFSTKYPFRTLSLVEVPVQFYSYPRMSTQTRAELQPSMVLLPEKLSTLQNAGFKKQFTRQKKRNARNNQVITDKEIQVRLFNNFIRNTFISGENFRFRGGRVINEPTRYRLGPSFYFFKNNFYSSEYPVINAVFESHLQKVSAPQGGMRNAMGILSENDRANLILREASFRDILAMNPGSDTIRAVLTVKGDYLFNLMRCNSGIDEFKEWFQKYIEDNEFRRINISEMNEEMKKKFGFEFYPYLNNWFNRKEQPGFLFSDPQVYEVVADNRLRYLVTFIVSNPESAPGIFNVAFRTGGPGAGRGGGGGMMVDVVRRGGPGGGSFAVSMQGRGMDAADISKIVEVGPSEAKKIGIILDAQPRVMMVNTLFARNIPGEINKPLQEIIKSKNKSVELKEEEMIIPMPVTSMPGEIIVDNEDPGFYAGGTVVQSPLKRLLGVKASRNTGYEEINAFWPPESWQQAVQSAYYGKYILSSVFTKGGSGDRSVRWTTKIDEPGYYDIYCYVGKLGGGRINFGARRAGGGGGPGGGPEGPGVAIEGGGPGGGPMRGEQENPYKDMHYRIYHDEGVEEITVDFENAEGGWNILGRYYLSPDSVKVELTNKSAGKVVLGDAIRWVKAE